ncbi:MAG: helix-turn-helix transcriptional regulator [Brumimicrobium sp.]
MNLIIAKNFKKLRDTLGFTQDKVGEYLDCSREEISYYENGSREMPLSILERASDLFGVELEDFFSDEESVGIRIAYRADNYSVEDLNEISRFKRIIKNYQRMNRLMDKASL